MEIRLSAHWIQVDKQTPTQSVFSWCLPDGSYTNTNDIVIYDLYLYSVTDGECNLYIDI